jgi:uncharacterized damage-inducible protein DinB
VNQSQQIADSYHAATVEGAWHGPSLAELLAEITPELATTHAIPGAHTIAELLQHLLLWNERVRNTSESNPLPPWQADKEWAEPPIPWSDLVARWNRSRDLLETLMRNIPAEDLPKPVPGRDYPYENMLHGVVHHAIYHSGQIAMLLSLLRSRAAGST